MKKLAILFSGDLENVSIGGISQYIQEIIRHEEEYEVTLFGTCEEGTHILGKEYQKELDGHRYKFIPVTDDARRPLFLYFYLKVHRYLKQLANYDVIYCQRMEYIIPFLFSRSKTKTIMAVHGSGAYTVLWRGKMVSIFYNIVERLAVNICNRVIVLQKRDEFGVPYYKKKYSRHKDKIFFGRVPIDDKVFNVTETRRNTDEKHVKNIIYLGRIDDNPKRVMIFPDIAKQLYEDGIEFTFHMIGDGVSMNDIKRKIDDYHLQNRFKFYGKMNHGTQLTEILNQGDVAIILSSFEGICMSALECIACGTPVVATDVGDINSYIKDGINGIIIPNGGNITGNAVIAVEEILRDGCELNDVYLEYTPQKMISELEEIFEG